MNSHAKLLFLEAKNFVRDKMVLWGMLGLVAFGLYSFYHGSSVIGRQKATIASIPAVQSRHLEHVAEEGKGKSAGTTAYYPFFYTVNTPSPWAAFSIGQRDVNAFSLKVKILGIEGQLYDSELTNPLTLLVGNLDASFVFIFLFPLLVIAFTYNVVAQEQDSGVWKIVQTNSGRLLPVILSKMAVRLAFILMAFLLVLIPGILLLRLPASLPTLQIWLVLLAYELFWFAFCMLVVALGKNASFNATALVAAWIFLCILFPGLANVLISERVKVPEALETTVQQREGYHAKWDEPKKPTMEVFYKDYPQYRKYPIPEDVYSPGWYYAMQYAGEVESRASAAELVAKLGQRQALAAAFARFDPVIAAQQALNRIANTDLDNHISYLQSVRDYHRQLREFFYLPIFENTPTENLDWKATPQYRPMAYDSDASLSGMGWIVGWTAASVIFSLLFFRKNFIYKTDNHDA